MNTISADLALTIILLTGLVMYATGLYVGKNWNNFVKE